MTMPKLNTPTTKQMLLVVAGMLISAIGSSIERAKSEELTREMVKEIVGEELKKLK